MTDSPANDALLAQLVRGALGRSGRGTSGINVSSCAFVVTLHGIVGSVAERDMVEMVSNSVPGVEAVKNELRVTYAPVAVSEGIIRGISKFRANLLRQDGGK